MRDLVAARIGEAQERCGFALRAWVVMPEHVHLIIGVRDGEWPVPRILRAIKQPVAQRVIARWRELRAPVLERITCADGRVRFWQTGGGFDRNVRNEDELVGEIGYVNRNPVKRGLVEKPEEWRWSSARWFAGAREGEIAIDPWRKGIFADWWGPEGGSTGEDMTDEDGLCH